MTAWRTLTGLGLLAIAGCKFDPEGAGALPPRPDSAVVIADAEVMVDAAPVIDAPAVIVDALPPDVFVPPDVLIFMDAPDMPGEGCLAPFDLGTMMLGTTKAVVGSTAGARNDYTTSCNTENHPDHLYKFEVGAHARVVATLTPSGWNAALASATGFVCALATPLTCSQGSGAPVSVVIDAFPANEYWLWVDGANSGGGVQAGNYSLSVDVQIP